MKKFLLIAVGIVAVFVVFSVVVSFASLRTPTTCREAAYEIEGTLIGDPPYQRQIAYVAPDVPSQRLDSGYSCRGAVQFYDAGYGRIEYHLDGNTIHITGI